MDDLLLTRAALFASTELSSLSKRDMLGLARLAGFDDASPIMETIAAQPEGLILTDSAVVKRLIKLAEKRAWVAPGRALRQN